MYFLVRIILLLILLLVAILILWKRAALRKKTVMALIFATIGLAMLLRFCPVENVFISFDSPESVFHYMRAGEIQSVVEGEHSALVVYSKDQSTSSTQVVEKTDGTYKIPVFGVLKSVDSGALDTTAGHYEVLQVSGTEDYYICVSVMMTNPVVSVSDSFSDDVSYTVSEMVGSNTSVVSIYTYSNEWPDNYYLDINENRILELN